MPKTKEVEDTRPEWEIKAEELAQVRSESMAHLTPDQMEAIHNTYDAMKDFMDEYSDSFDVTSETARKLQSSFWKISYEFHMGDR
jgi:hypothetical protein